MRPTKVASDVRDQRDRLLAKLGEQTFRLIAERKLQVPKVLQESVEKLAALLGVQLPPQPNESDSSHGSGIEGGEGFERSERSERRETAEARIDHAAADASDPLYGSDYPAEIDEPSIGDTREATPTPAKPAVPPKKASAPKKGGAKRRAKR